MTNEMDQLFNDIISECKSESLVHFSISVRDRLEKYERNVRKEIVSRMKDDCAPLFHAGERGKVEMVEYLISTCDADVEQKGWYSSSGEMVTPLWRLTVSGYLPVVKCLISHGSQVNAVSDFGTTPVHAACYDPLCKFGGFMRYNNTYEEIPNVVEYLVEHGADIRRVDDFGRTCLMEAIHDVKLCALLLKNGVDVNVRDAKGRTALLLAIKAHKFDTVVLLLEYNADPNLRSHHNDDAVQMACFQGQIEIWSYLLTHVSYTREKIADSIELMGACYYEDEQDLQKALLYWRTAIEMRNSHLVDGKPLAKTPSLPKRVCYGNASEFTTLDELNAIALDSDALRIQHLLIREKILGEHHKRTFYAVMDTAAFYAEALRYEKSIDLWRRALEISVVSDSQSMSSVCHAAEGLVRAMIDLNEQTLEVANNRETENPRFADVVTIFKLLTRRLLIAWQLLEIVNEKRPLSYGAHGNSYNKTLLCITHCIYLLLKTAKISDAEDEIRELVRDLVKQNPKSIPENYTLLHVCVARWNVINSSYFTYALAIFPHLGVVKCLLECGAYVNARDVEGETPLHIASRVPNFSNPLIKLLLDHGAHLDAPNKSGSTPAREISTNPHNTVDLMKYMTLRCHAAQVILKYNIQCDELPATLHQFLDVHRG